MTTHVDDRGTLWIIPEGIQYLTEDYVDVFPIEKLLQYGHALARDRNDAAELAAGFTEALSGGRAATKRQMAFALWILQPVVTGDHPNRLPFQMRKRGEKKAPTRDARMERMALQVHALRFPDDGSQGLTRDDAIATVADSENEEASLRGHYQRFKRNELDQMLKSARALGQFAREYWAHRKG